MAIEECAFRNEHPQIAVRLKLLEERTKEQSSEINSVKDLVSQVNVQLAGLQGRIAGAVWAAGTIGAVVGAAVGIGVQFLKR